jgi:hypothetical protein
MAFILSFSEEMHDPCTLFVMEDEAAIDEHAARFCGHQGLEFNHRANKAKVEYQGRTYRWHWTCPQDAYVDSEKPNRWVLKHAGRQFSRIEFHVPVPPPDLNYLIGRMRGLPLSLANK